MTLYCLWGGEADSLQLTADSADSGGTDFSPLVGWQSEGRHCETDFSPSKQSKLSIIAPTSDFGLRNPFILHPSAFILTIQNVGIFTHRPVSPLFINDMTVHISQVPLYSKSQIRAFPSSGFFLEFLHQNS